MASPSISQVEKRLLDMRMITGASTPLQPRLRAQRGRSAQPRRASTMVAVPPEEWITVPVPALVDAALFAAAQEQLQENRRRARQRQSPPRAGHLRAVRLRLLRQGGQRAGGQGAPAGVRLLPLHRD